MRTLSLLVLVAVAVAFVVSRLGVARGPAAAWDDLALGLWVFAPLFPAKVWPLYRKKIYSELGSLFNVAWKRRHVLSDNTFSLVFFFFNRFFCYVYYMFPAVSAQLNLLREPHYLMISFTCRQGNPLRKNMR